MAPRPSWRGYLKLSLVTCPVAMLPATSEAEKVRFHTLNRATGSRVHARYVDAETGKPVDDEDQVKGYEREDGEYVMLSRVVLYHRERAVLLEPRDKGMVLWTLRYGDEVRDEAEYFEGIKGKPGPKEKKLLASLIAEHTQDWSPSLATDPVEQSLRSMIEAKEKRARRSTKKLGGAKGGNVIDLMAVLKKSLQGGLPQRR